MQTFAVGRRFKVCHGSGTRSDQKATVVEPFDWKLEEGAYQPPSPDQVPLRYDDGSLGYMSGYRLIPLKD